MVRAHFFQDREHATELHQCISNGVDKQPHGLILVYSSIARKEVPREKEVALTIFLLVLWNSHYLSSALFAFSSSLPRYLQFAACKGQRDAKQGCPFVVVRESVTPLFLTEDEAVEGCKAVWIPIRYRVIVGFSLGAFIILFLCTLFAALAISKRRQRQMDRNFIVSGGMPYSPLVSSPSTLWNTCLPVFKFYLCSPVLLCVFEVDGVAVC